MSPRIRTRSVWYAISLGIVLGIAGAASGTAFAATTTTTTSAGSSPGAAQPSNPQCTLSAFSQAQQQVEAALSARVTQLSSLLAQVNNSTNHLTSTDRQTLATDISSVELPGIEGLQTHVQQDTTCIALRTDAHAMVFNYRVFAVMTPQTHLIIVADDEAYIESVFSNLEPTINSAIAAAQSQGKDVTAAQASFTDLQSQVSSAQGDTTGEDATLLAQTPQGSPGNWATFLGSRTSLTEARSDLHTAYTDAQQIRTDLQ